MATTIQTAALSDFYSPALKQDTAFMAISDALTPVLQDFAAQIQAKAIIFPNLANQPEAILDFIALYHFNVDAYDTTWPFPQKLASVQNVMLDKLTKGTAARVRSVVAQSGLKYAEVVEWWQTTPPGPPYTFSVVIADPNPSEALINATVANIMKVKNVRSYFSGIGSIDTPSGVPVYVSVSAGEIGYEVVGTSHGRP
jgi:phage tail P2-like protein